MIPSRDPAASRAHPRSPRAGILVPLHGAALALAFLGLAAGPVACGGSEDDTRERVAPPSPGPDPQTDRPQVIPLTFTDENRVRVAGAYAKRLEGQTDFTFDASLGADQKTLLQYDLVTIAETTRDAAGVPDAEVYRAAFGSPDAAGVMRYLGERIKVFLGSEPRVRLTGERGAGTPFLVGESGLAQRNDDAFLTAQNYGTLAWYTALKEKAGATALGLTVSYPVGTMRDGLVSVLPGYTNLVVGSDGAKRRLSSPATLVHEARHSDCTIALSQADVERIRTTGDFLKGNTQCGHLHQVCPKGHNLEGKNACDDHRWGAYEIAGLYNKMLADTCADCAEDEKASYEYAALEAFSRLLVARSGERVAGPAVPDMAHREPGPADQ